MVHLCSMSKKLTNFSHVEARLILEKLRWENIITPNNHVCEASEDPPAHQHSINFGFLKASWENTKSWNNIRKPKIINFHTSEDRHSNDNDKEKKVYSKKQSNRVSVWKRGGSHRYNITIVALRYSVLWLMVENHGGIMCFLSSNNQSKIETLDERTYKVNWDSINQLIWFLYCTNYKFDL